MSAIYLKHHRHGAKVAVSEDEAEADKKRGWVEFDIDDEMSKKEVKAVKAAELKGQRLAATMSHTVAPVTSATSSEGKELQREGAPASAILEADIRDGLEHQGEASPEQEVRPEGVPENAVKMDEINVPETPVPNRRSRRSN